MINVVCGIIYNSGKVFIARKIPSKSFGGKWEFPGGKVKEGEDQKEALSRELYEELGMRVMIGDFITSNQFSSKEKSINLIAYKCEFLSATYNMIDHDRYEWIQPEDLPNWDLAPADIPIAKTL